MHPIRTLAGVALAAALAASWAASALASDHGRATVGVLPSAQGAAPAGTVPALRFPGAPGGQTASSQYGGSGAMGQAPTGQIPPGGGFEPTPEPGGPGLPSPGTKPGPDAVDPGTDIPPPNAPGADGGATDIPPPSVPDADAGATPFDPAAGLPDVAAPDLGPGLDTGALSAAEQLAGLGSEESLGAPELIGDSFGLSILQRLPNRPNPPPNPPNPPVPPRPPVPPTSYDSVALVPSIRSIKMSENQSPVPTDRILYSFSYFNNVNYAINQRFQAPISNIMIYRHIFGFEKTLFSENFSVSVRFPINTITADSPLPGIGATSTAINTTNILAKWAFYRDDEAGQLLSTGMALGIPTGPSRFAGADYLDNFSTVVLQPFLGMLFYGERLFFQGFSFLEIPTDRNAPTVLFNDYALGYYVYKDPTRESFLSGVAPLFEVHITTPLSHRGVRLEDPLSLPDIVSFTYGTAWEFGKRTRLLTGIVTPVTGPRPFDFEVQALLNIFF